MRTLLLAVVIASSTLACSSSDGTTTSSGTDAGTETSSNPCEGLGCASMPGPLVIKVVDPSGAEVKSPKFSQHGAPLTATCEDKSDTGAGLCSVGWTIQLLPEGTQTIDVSAPGYVTQTITVKIEGPSSCCGTGPEVDRTVTLGPTPLDAGGE